ncbi:hypothetical protein H112_07023 [Trichophyton rubrum D6]|uniref:Uncharacterized protein n=2 Tax=Trichophyton rubrum TaxID=5551 RepID=A0A080WHM7_TRIRC|nr:uncharacterized protein TERG_11839 [Trichophyton rubrum CBS 118892]EZF11961.1 hypothetical protein H100_07046 [Trichophyton rubrum MR850]EZF38822.1 hypothetical protein H102_07009 [Trichophyton rubrum CBS 100081]EZF49454.1 hypothetical protein H103_07031 [Trichophyton rubrum CBS 288.86]EZF60062.1 hypothetical protein H104_06986 [Trichophyton rubrum CBS 289.86]EZF81465.1 hypothetical protein H110_07027 [Trichophyton rubrum MR1448]EZF92023.1 hypothetical protein H113_07082 [Trichophyton rubr
MSNKGPSQKRRCWLATGGMGYLPADRVSGGGVRTQDTGCTINARQGAQSHGEQTQAERKIALKFPSVLSINFTPAGQSTRCEIPARIQGFDSPLLEPCLVRLIHIQHECQSLRYIPNWEGACRKQPIRRIGYVWNICSPEFWPM